MHGVMAHLYIAARTDNPAVLKVGRSNNPERKCVSLQSGHCFEVKPLAIWPDAGEYETGVHRILEAVREPGPGREWFRACPAEVYSAVALAMRRKRRRSPSPLRSMDDMVRDLLGRLEIAKSASGASLQAEVDALARQLYGVESERVIARAGLMRLRTRVLGDDMDRNNRFLYVRCAGPDGPRRWVALRRPSPPSTSEGSAEG